MTKWWGCPIPGTLEFIFTYLTEDGFKLSSSTWNDPAVLSLSNNLNDDLSVGVSFTSSYSEPGGVFIFDTSIHVYSRYVGDVDWSINIWDRDFSKIDWSGADKEIRAIFGVTLSHLKWNEEVGPNPHWVSTTDGGASGRCAAEADAWINDWKRFGEPWVAPFYDVSNVIDYLNRIDSLEKSPWVKSDGPKSTGRFIFIGILLVKQGKRDVAISLLGKVLEILDAIAEKQPLGLFDERIRRATAKVLRWAQQA